LAAAAQLDQLSTNTELLHVPFVSREPERLDLTQQGRQRRVQAARLDIVRVDVFTRQLPVPRRGFSISRAHPSPQREPLGHISFHTKTLIVRRDSDVERHLTRL